ncbi:MAG: chromate transporter [Eubacteriales bacterium]|nr:chromate transporter [Eubacteriales bacterium]MDD4717444.1 chromate transporter [Eubacteriales bacterium]
MIFWQLFWSFFQIGILSFGGGLAAIPLIQNQIVDIRGWLSIAEFTDLIAISEMTPGPIAINSATFVGSTVAGPVGAIVSTLGCVLPSSLIVVTIAWLFGKYKDLYIIRGVLAGLRPAVVALILSAGLSILSLSVWGEKEISLSADSTDFAAAALIVIGLLIIRKFKINPIIIILSSGIIGGVYYLII